jgi:hypothetical protein
MIKFIISEKFAEQGLNNVVTGYKIAELVFNSPNFGHELLKVSHFTYTDDTPKDVFFNYVGLKESPTFEIEVEPYYYKNSSVVGMTKGDKVIYVNTNGAKNRISGDYMENALHELAHYPMHYGHGNNFPNGFRSKLLGDIADKTKSVPYVFSAIGKKIYKEIL